ncbi:ABC transporter permease [Pseudoroseicyclus aestuarii]|uniref:Putative ABC transport system permease protein n=1 Tax=Pseudoroseicyclus aestuarii TaxID=1795041 RepID=A0A318T5M1_9RHOB|nr:ABC transporter permease [Pseudoroseicyclus aestuarii]PYE83658.1 putative ABC transport system permease protein [Pseudoroseicyclus aestuarii]
MNRAVLSALLSHWRRAPLQLLTLVLGLALATGLWTGVQAINTEARSSYDAAAATLGEGAYDQLVPEDGGSIAQETYVALRRAGWQVSPVVEGRLAGQRLVGIDPLTAPGALAPVQVDGADIAAFLGAGEIFGRPEVLEALPETGARLVPDPGAAPGTALTDIGLAQRLLDRDGQIDRLVVAPGQPLGRPPLAEVAPALVLRPAQDGSDIGRLTDSFHLNLTAFGLLAFAVGIFIVHGAVGLSFEQRRPMLRTLRALGVPLRRLLALMGAELLGLALVAGILGVGLGWLMAALLLPNVAATLRGLYGAEVAGTLALRPGWLLSGLAVALIGTALASASAFARLARMPLLSGGQPRAWAMGAAGGRTVQTLAALALLGAAGALALWGKGLIAGFACLAALLLGGALALPLLLGLVLGAGERAAKGPLAQWFWADSRQQLPGLSLALMALLLAMAANVGVSTMVSSFRLTFTAFLDQRLAAELYVQAADPAQAERIEAIAAPATREILPLASVDRELEGAPGQVQMARDAQTYRDNWQFLRAVPGVWDRLAAGQGLLVNEQLFRRADLDLGDALEVAPGRALPVIGVYGDYGNPSGEAILGEEAFRRLYPDALPLRFGLRLPPDQVPALRAALEEAGVPQAAMTDQAALKAFSLGVFERTFSVTAALNVLTLGVAGFAILMSLLTLAAMRLPQLAPVWALGLTRARLGRLELIRAVLLAALTALAALPLGLALAWILLAVVNVEAFGWRLPMTLFPWDYARLGLLALLAALLAAAWPAWRLARTPPAALLKVFAGER